MTMETISPALREQIDAPAVTTLHDFCERFMQALRSDCNSELHLRIGYYQGSIVLQSECSDHCQSRKLSSCGDTLAHALLLLTKRAEEEQKRQELRSLLQTLDEEGVVRMIAAAKRAGMK